MICNANWARIAHVQRYMHAWAQGCGFPSGVSCIARRRALIIRMQSMGTKTRVSVDCFRAVSHRPGSGGALLRFAVPLSLVYRERSAHPRQATIAKYAPKYKISKI